MSDTRRLVEIIEGHGTLNYKVEWQSVDGRLSYKYHETLNEAREHADNLASLGRHPFIYGKIEPGVYSCEK